MRRPPPPRKAGQLYNPAIDARYQIDKVTSHAGGEFEATPVAQAQDIRERLQPDTTVVAIDEAQFFEDSIVPVVQGLAESGVRVIVAGLDSDFRGEAFGPMPVLLAVAERVEKLQAICMLCGEPASRTQRLIDGVPAHVEDPVIVVGASELYEARCRRHHMVRRGPR